MGESIDDRYMWLIYEIGKVSGGLACDELSRKLVRSIAGKEFDREWLAMLRDQISAVLAETEPEAQAL
jgi:hypothetical protein